MFFKRAERESAASTATSTKVAAAAAAVRTENFSLSRRATSAANSGLTESTWSCVCMFALAFVCVQ